MSEIPQSAKESWHLDKKVPIALILAIIGQTFFAGMVLSDMRASIADHEKRITNEERQSAARIMDDKVMIERLARIEEKLTSLIDEFRRIRSPAEGGR